MVRVAGGGLAKWCLSSWVVRLLGGVLMVVFVWTLA